MLHFDLYWFAFLIFGFGVGKFVLYWIVHDDISFA